MKMHEFEKLLKMAKYRGVSFIIDYSEASDSWEGEIISAAPSECCCWKKCHRDSIFKYMIEHLEKRV